jgi:ABC-type nickel/cobalt efflux system permease component RcnA
MPVTALLARHRVWLVAAVAILLLVAGLDWALAQPSPFGVPRPAAPAPADVGGVVGWLLAKQAQFYRSLSGLIRAAKADGSAMWGLLGISFVYGIFHAAGPGHGKAVISSYLVANEETWRRGIVLSFASALLQALVAVAVVAVAAVALNATAKSMNNAVRVIEIVSYSLIALVGARLTFVKGRALLAEWRARAAASAHHHDHARGAHDHDHDHGHAHHHEAAAHPAHRHDEHCDHSHGPEPQELAGPGGWQRGLSAIVAVGLRPCSGAILVLVFALAQGLFWAGVASTFVMGLGTAITVAAIATFAVGAKTLAKRLTVHRAGTGALLLRGIELGAAVLVLVFGAALLAGYMVSERMI